jgi:hypothetical protein
MTDKDYLDHLTAAQARAVTSLELDLPRMLSAIGLEKSPIALVAAIKEAALPVEGLRYIARMIDRHADEVERAKDMRGG